MAKKKATKKAAKKATTKKKATKKKASKKQFSALKSFLKSLREIEGSFFFPNPVLVKTGPRKSATRADLRTSLLLTHLLKIRRNIIDKNKFLKLK